jgi:hypothetical protein
MEMEIIYKVSLSLNGEEEDGFNFFFFLESPTRKRNYKMGLNEWRSKD